MLPLKDILASTSSSTATKLSGAPSPPPQERIRTTVPQEPQALPLQDILASTFSSTSTRSSGAPPPLPQTRIRATAPMHPMLPEFPYPARWSAGGVVDGLMGSAFSLHTPIQHPFPPILQSRAQPLPPPPPPPTPQSPRRLMERPHSPTVGELLNTFNDQTPIGPFGYALPPPQMTPTARQSAQTTGNPRRRRTLNTSDASTPVPSRRKPRLQYDAEQDDFIRFCRDDLCQSWDATAKLYNQFWHATGENMREIPGLQSRYYRLLDESVRDRKKEKLGRPELGILAKTPRRYWWMAGAFTDQEREEIDREKHEMTRKRKRATSSGMTSGSADEDESQSEAGSEDSKGFLPPSRIQDIPTVQDKGKGKENESTTPLVSPASNSSGDEDDSYERICSAFGRPAALWATLRFRNALNAYTGTTYVPATGDSPPGAIGACEPLTILDAIRHPRRVGSARVERRIRTRTRTGWPRRPRHAEDSGGESGGNERMRAGQQQANQARAVGS